MNLGSEWEIAAFSIACLTACRIAAGVARDVIGLVSAQDTAAVARSIGGAWRRLDAALSFRHERFDVRGRYVRRFLLAPLWCTLAAGMVANAAYAAWSALDARAAAWLGALALASLGCAFLFVARRFAVVARAL